MKNIDENIDYLFRSKLKDHEVVPPGEVWEGIISAIDSKKRKRRIFFIWGISSAASLLLAFIGGWYFANNDLGKEESIATVTVQEERIEEKEIDNSTVAVYDNLNNQHNTTINEVHESGITYRNKISKEITGKDVIIEKTDNGNSKENLINRLISSGRVLLQSNKKADYSLIAMNSGGLSESDKAIIESNISSLKKEKGKKGKGNWAIGVEGSPAYRFDQSSNTESSDFYSSNEITPVYVTNMTGGLKVSYNTGNNLSFQSGINYGEVSQKADNITVSYLGQNWLNDRFFTAGENKANALPDEGEGVSNEVEFNTKIGSANVSMQEGANIVAYDSYNNLSQDIARSYEFNQKAGYIEVPFILKYKLINSRLGLHILGGINTNFLVLNDVRIANSNEIVAQGAIEGLTPLTFSSSLGFGLNYSLSEHFYFTLEPTIKMQLNSLNTQSDYNSKPYLMGIFTGISYNF